eukprot:c20125_g1_i1 orf=439-2703(-)
MLGHLKKPLHITLLSRSCCQVAQSFFFSADMVQEDQAGITCYANSARGFRGILKQRYADFIVNEVDCEGKVIHLTNLNAPEEVIEGQVDDLQEDQDLNCLNMEKHIEAFKALSGNGDADLLRSLLTKYMDGKKDKCSPIVLSPDSDKSHRTEVHSFVKSRLPFLVTDTVDGPDSKSKCVRVRVVDDNCKGGRNNGKRMRGFKGSRDKKKRQKHENGDQGFDSRGAEDWPSQHGKFLQFHFYKENKDTQDALMVLGKFLGVQSRSFGIAGTKDKRAVTTQRVTVFKQQASRLAALNKKLYGIKVGDFSYVDKALVLGQLSGNQFTITLRGVAAEDDDIIKEAAVSLGNSGFINYFGLQRFGTGAVPTFTVGAALLRGDWEAAVHLILQPRDGERQDVMEARDYFMKTKDADGTLLRMPRQFVTERAVLAGLRKSPGNYLQAINSIPRTMRMMFVHSYQSYLWNHAASKRIELYGVSRVVEGDLVLCSDSENDVIASKSEAVEEDESIFSEAFEEENGHDNEVLMDVVSSSVKHVTADDVACEKFSIIDVVLPMTGSKTSLPANDVASVYEELAKRDSLDLRQSSHNVKEFSFLHLSGSYRRLIQVAKDFDWKIIKYDDHTRALAETDWGRINKKVKKVTNTSQEAAVGAEEMSTNTKGEEVTNTSQEAAVGAEEMSTNTKGEEVTNTSQEAAVGADEMSTSTKGEEKVASSPTVQTALQLQFTLPSSCYATMALRELMKISSSVEYHKALTEEGS